METLTATRTNVQIVKEAFDHFLKGNISAILEVCSDNVEWGSYENPDVPYAGIYKGKAGVLDFFTTLAGNVTYSVFEPTEYISEGDDVVVFGRHAGTANKTGKSFDHNWCFSFKISNGKVDRFFSYVDSRDHSQAFK
jgi:ketosteroid isomerase-like protein